MGLPRLCGHALVRYAIGGSPGRRKNELTAREESILKSEPVERALGKLEAVWLEGMR